MGDIVFLRAWTQVEVPCFYNPLTTALQPRDKTWQGMKTVAELRREHNLPVPVNKDSLYRVSTHCCLKLIYLLYSSLPQKIEKGKKKKERHGITKYIPFFVQHSYLLFFVLFYFNSQLKGSQRSSIHWLFPHHYRKLCHLPQSPRTFLLQSIHSLKLSELLLWNLMNEKCTPLFNTFSSLEMKRYLLEN